MPPRLKRRVVAPEELPANTWIGRVTNGRQTMFRAILNRKFTGGKSQRKNFKRKDKAVEWCWEQENNRKAIVDAELTYDEVAEAKRAFLRLRPYDLRLDDVVHYYFTEGPGGRPTLILSKAVERFQTYLQQSGWKEKSIKAQGISTSVLIETMGDKPLYYYTPERMDAWFKTTSKERKWGATNRANYLRDFRMLFKYCVETELIPKNPFEHPSLKWITNARQKEEEERVVEIFTSKECALLLRTAMENPHLDLLGWLVVALFGGPRVEELKKLSWSAFRDDDQQIVLGKKDVAKGGDPRHIKYSETLQAWLKIVPRTDGKLIDLTNLRNRRDELFEKAKVQKKKNGLRHTFASHHYVQYGDAQSTRDVLGHRTEETLFKHYVELVEQKEARAFWALRPPTDVTVQEPSRRGRPRKRNT